LLQAYTVTDAAPRLLQVAPPHGRNDASNEVILRGLNFAPGLTGFIGETPLLNVYLLNSKVAKATIPAGLPGGVYSITVHTAGGTGELSNAYTVLGVGDQDLSVTDNDVWLFPATLRTGDQVQIGVNIRRQGGQDILNPQVAFYLGNPETGGALLAITTTQNLPAGTGEMVSAAISWTVDAAAATTPIVVVVNPSHLIPESSYTNNRAQREVIVLPPEANSQAPAITEFSLEPDTQLVTDTVISLNLHAQAGPASMLLKEYVLNSLSAEWILVQESGWIPYQQQFDATLSDMAGVRTLKVWAADHRGNISTPSSLVFNYLPQQDAVAKDQRRVYRFNLDAGQTLQLDLQTLAGDADLYLWAGDGKLVSVSDRSSTDNDGITFAAAQSGIYQVEVVGYAASTYHLSVNLRQTLTAHSRSKLLTKVVLSAPSVPPDRDLPELEFVPAAPLSQFKVFLPAIRASSTLTYNSVIRAFMEAIGIAMPTNGEVLHFWPQ
jgi:hypothetical protein